MRQFLLLLVLACANACANSRGGDDAPPLTTVGDRPPGGGHGDGDGGAKDAAPDQGNVIPSARAPIVYGDYAALLNDPAGKIDVESTVARLAEAHVNLYAYLIYQRSQAEWDTLPAFLTAAAAKGIQVWVYLVPPTEAPTAVACTGSAYPPYHVDYVEWAKQIAALSLTHKNLTGFALDDFGYNTLLSPAPNCTLFSEAYIHRMVTAAHAIAPTLEFYPVLYWENLEGSSSVVSALRGDITGVIFPFRDGLNLNTYVTASALPQLEALGSSLSCARDHGAAATRGRSGCMQFAFPWRTSSPDGASASASQTITVGAGPRSVTFSWQHDFLGATAGYVSAQLLVDDAVVWEADIGQVTRYVWRTQTVALDAALAGKSSARLELRVMHKKGVSNFGQTVWFDEVEGSGLTLANGDFEQDGASWSLTQWSGFTVMPVRTASLVTMVYAGTLSTDLAHPPTASYVGAVLDVGLSMARKGYADGTMTYVLDKRAPDTPIFARVAKTYQR